MPKVSIIISAYNHEKYIATTLKSILNQTFEDFELIIVDNGSTDSTYKIIKDFIDKRIRIFKIKKNAGFGYALNFCLKKNRGQYISLFTSDDLSEPDKLKKQVRYLDEHPQIGAVFSKVQIINEEGKNINNYYYDKVFNQENKNNYQWLNYFFYKGNCLCFPTVLIRKSVYKEVGLENERLAQLHDLDFWIRLSFRYNLQIISKKLVKFRIREGNKNASAQTPETTARSMFEFGHVLKNYLKIKNVDEFLKIFPEAKKYNDIVDDELIPFYLARQALGVEHIFHQKFGLDVLFDLLQNEEMVKKLQDKCNFNYSDFIKLTGKHDLYHVNHIEYQNNLIAKLKQENEELKKPKRQLKELVNHLKNYFSKYA